MITAPSWSGDNALATVGHELIASIAGAGYRTVVRPHPAFFESIYPEGRQIVADLEGRFGEEGKSQPTKGELKQALVVAAQLGD